MLQTVTPDLARWISDLRQSGISDDIIFRSLLSKGWNPVSATAALSHPSTVPSNGTSEEASDYLRGFVEGVPEPSLSGGNATLWVGG